MKEWLDLIASAATAIGVIAAAVQLWEARRQARTEFEDGLSREYRELAQRLPVEALLGSDLEGDALTASLGEFYGYVDLSNEQVFLRMNGRVSTKTWRNWADGIRTNLARPAFKKAWSRIKEEAPDSFEELRRLEKASFGADPLRW